jgi:hypothetical protein
LFPGHLLGRGLPCGLFSSSHFFNNMIGRTFDFPPLPT